LSLSTIGSESQACNNTSMMLYVKAESPPDVQDALRKIEERADSCFSSLKLLKLHWNVAVWALLVGGIKAIEEEIATHGENTHQLTAAFINLSRLIPVSMRWAVSHGRPDANLASRRWSPSIAAKVDEAMSVANQYFSFLSCFPLWHADRYAVELLSPAVARFTMKGSERDRQVSAYQKGLRPREGRYTGRRAEKAAQTREALEHFDRVMQTCRKTGMRRFEYEIPWELWRRLLPEYKAKVDATARRPDTLCLGDYSLGEFKEFYAALLAVCAAHEFLCFEWGRHYGEYPLDSAVLIYSRTKWSELVSKLSGIAQVKCESMLKDLTFDFSRSVDLHVHPFVPLNASAASLALAPQFPLHSRPDENILRICSILRPAEFDVTSNEKESEILSAINKIDSPHMRQGPIPLPQPNPDIDLIVSDESSSTIVIAELKWIRKVIRPIERVSKDAEIHKGMHQLSQIRQFLSENPNYLNTQGKLPKSMPEYQHKYFFLVARDHWIWVEPSEDIAIVEFDPFTAAIARPGSLHSAMSELLMYEWLPVEGRDFIVQYDRATANGVSIESEVVYST
jgi:hypothetical protein